MSKRPREGTEGEEVGGSPSEQAQGSEAIVKQYVYHINDATCEVVKVEELDDKTGERREVPEVSQYVYHVKEGTGELVKVEEIDDRTGERKEILMQDYGMDPYGADPYGYDPYGYDPSGMDAYGATGYEG